MATEPLADSAQAAYRSQGTNRSASLRSSRQIESSLWCSNSSGAHSAGQIAATTARQSSAATTAPTVAPGLPVRGPAVSGSAVASAPNAMVVAILAV